MTINDFQRVDPHSGYSSVTSIVRFRLIDLERSETTQRLTAFFVSYGLLSYQYIFYSPKLKLGVVPEYKNGAFEVTTNTPVRDATKIWGTDRVSLSGALVIPENEASASSSHWSSTPGETTDHHRPREAHRGTYDRKDCTEEVCKNLQLKRSADGARFRVSTILQQAGPAAWAMFPNPTP